MDLIRFLLALAAAFAFIFVFDFGFHGIYMKDAWYDAYAQFWRPPEEALMHMMLVGQLLMALAIGMTLVFSGKSGIGAGVSAGCCVGLAFSSLYLVFYAVQPFPGGMVFNWVLGAVGESILAGALFGAIYRSHRHRI